MGRLTDTYPLQVTTLPSNALLYAVDVTDPTDNIAGSSKKIEVDDFVEDFTASQAEVDAQTITNKFVTPETLGNTSLGFDLILTQAASASTSIEFINLSDYSDYLVVVSGVAPSNNAVNFSIRMSNDNGATFENGSVYRYALTGRHTDGGNTVDNDNADNQIIFNDNGGGNQVGNQATSSYAAEIMFLGLDSTTKDKHVTCKATYSTNTADRVASINAGGSFFGNVNAVNGIQFFFSAGTIATGTFKLYGIK